MEDSILQNLKQQLRTARRIRDRYAVAHLKIDIAEREAILRKKHVSHEGPCAASCAGHFDN